MMQLEHVTKRYGMKTIINDITVEFCKGMIYGLIGANGSGKSTLIRCICGFIPVTSGLITVNGKRIGKDTDFPPKTGLVTDVPGFLPQYSGLRNLMILAAVSGDADKNRAMVVMQLLGLDPVDTLPVGKYSLGMIRRLGIAQALMGDPDILLLDQSLVDLDEGTMSDIYGLIRRLKSDGKTVLLTGNSLQDIRITCDVVCRMDAGKLIVDSGKENALSGSGK